MNGVVSEAQTGAVTGTTIGVAIEAIVAGAGRVVKPIADSDQAARELLCSERH